MNQVRKKFYRNIILEVLFVIIMGIAISIAFGNYVGNNLVDYIHYFDISEKGLTEDDLRPKMLDPIIAKIERLWVEDDRVYYEIKGINAGETFLVIYDKNTEKSVTSEEFIVSDNGMVRNITTGNYSNCTFYLLVNTLEFTLIAIIFIINLIGYRKSLRYSYAMMFIGGLLIWLTCTVISQWYAFINFDGVKNYYNILKQSGYRFILYTSPIVVSFSIAMTISNISLIKHERFRFRNILGIIISAILVLGTLIAIAVNNIELKGDEENIHFIRIIIAIYVVTYSIFASLLEGAIIGGIAAAKHNPPMDCDYIIILGCMIRKDGSLTPLLRGRVDRAIEHSKRQEALTGTKAVFVPSGGQGSNEVMAEGEAMKNYLLSNGISEDRILLENQSKNTFENMKFSKKLIDEQKPNAKIAFSTTNYHVYRSGIIATQNGFMPEGMGSRTKWYFWPNAFMREFVGMLVYTKLTILIVLSMLITSFSIIEIML